jgi:mono/diheme cytochrome c family protein
VRDPFQRGELRSFITRNTPHTFAPGAVQRLAEEMTQRLHAIAEHAQATACSRGRPQRAPLVAKGVSFGVIRARCDRLDTSQVVGVDSDLVVKPFQWKGSVASLRTFTRDAFHRELGMQPVELVGAGVDGDFDGVVDEISVGDVTAMTVYLAAQPRPTTKLELAALGLQELDASEAARIRTGEQVFERAQCSDCHRPALTLRDPIFREPSVDEHYRDAVLPAGQAPGAVGLDAARPLRFDLSADQPDNRIEVNGATIRLGALEKDERGRALVRLYGDLKRHDMGPGLAERVDEVGTGASVFLTENLWGVGSTPPYLHDGRATTLTEAILAHGGEAETSRRAFESLPLDEQRALVAFLGNLVLFVAE